MKNRDPIIQNPVIENAILETVGDEWIDLGLLSRRICVKLEANTEIKQQEISDLVAFYTGVLTGEEKLESKQVDLINKPGYYYMFRKPQ